MLEADPTKTPLAIKTTTQTHDNDLVNATEYHKLVDSLQYLTCTRPDIPHAIRCACQNFQEPTMLNLREVKRILRYLKDTVTFGLCFLYQSFLT